MRATFAILSLAAGALISSQSSFGQQAGSTIAEPSAITQSDAWRYVFENNRWWYYHPNSTWSTWNGWSWEPVPYTAGYRSNSLSAGAATTGAQRGAGAGNLSAVDAMPGRSNAQLSGGGMGINGSAVGSDGRNGGYPNFGGGAATRGSNAGRGPFATDAVPGRSNPQMYGGGIGIYGAPVGSYYYGAGGSYYGGRAGNISAVDALPGEANPQMVGGGLGHYGVGD